MKLKGILGLIVCMSILAMMTGGLKAATPGKSSERHAKDLTFQHGGVVLQNMAFVNNNTCDKAATLDSKNVSENEWKAEYKGSFNNGSKVDSWFKYTTHPKPSKDASPGSLSITCDQTGGYVEVELYEECGAWPISQSLIFKDQTKVGGPLIYQDLNNFNADSHNAIQINPPSTFMTSHDYIIHVSEIAKPASGALGYDLVINEDQYQPVIQ